MRNVAIIGMSFRFPGTDRESYWADLMAGRNLVTEVDPSRWDLESFRHPRRSNRGTSYTFAAGTLGDVTGFDAGFFGISPREAAQMDPQQRLMLELSWEAFEHAGIKPSAVRGSACGVYVGISSGDYGMRMADDLGAIDSLMITGNTSSITANRISYVFDLRGPSMAIDTACSSSLVAFHQACRAIASGECPVALAGGVSLHLHPLGFVAFSKASMLSRKGLCSVFDASGDGYVRSEGGGVFVLKEYEQAVADGDPIWAIVAGSVVNTDGKKSGLTVPSGRAQSSLLSQAYEAAGIAPSDISYIEAHGTGTPVGDPIETGALGDALGRHRDRDQPLLIGSVKSNLGHLEAASGVAGLVKALHCLHYRVVPATIHLENPNPHIRLADWNLRIVTANTPLAATGRLVIGVNSFGFGGANAHVILESPHPKVTTVKLKAAQRPRSVVMPVVISGKSEAALKAAASNLAHFLRTNAGTSLYDIASTATLRREWHEHRAIVYGATHKSLATALENFAQGKGSDTPVVSCTALAAPVTVAFVYSGNGSQWEGMGRRLLAEDAVFRGAVLAVEQIFEKYADFSLEAELAGKNGAGRYASTEIAQPALFAMQVGITEMLRSRGIMPAVVTGHSVGEVAAAWASGALTLEQAVQVIFHRSQLQGSTRGLGQMTAAAVGEPGILAILHDAALEQRIAIASVNSARGVTLAGDTQALDELELALATRNVTYKRLDLDYAFHCPLMDPIKHELRSRLELLRPRTETVALVSTVTGARLAGTQLDADYWWQNIRRPVLFERAITSILGAGSTLYVEIGPHAVLKGYIDSTLKDHPQHVGRSVATLGRGDDSPERVWSAASQALLAGAPVDVGSFFPDTGRLVALPNYPWQKEKLWHAVTSESHRLLLRKSVHPLLGYRRAQTEHGWENQIDPQLQPALADHVVAGGIVFPGAAFVELGLAVAALWQADPQAPASVLELDELDIKAPLVLEQDSAKTMRVDLDPLDGGFWVKARDRFSNEAWTVHAQGRILIESSASALAAHGMASLPGRASDFTGDEHLTLMHSLGLEYGPAFFAVQSGWIEGDSVWARLCAPSSIEAELSSHLLHPSLLDGAFQLVVHLLRQQINENSASMAYVPTRIAGLRLHRGRGQPVIAQARLLRATPHSLSASFHLFNGEGLLVASVETVRFKSVPMRRATSDHGILLEYATVPMPRHGRRAQAVTGLDRRVRESMQLAARGICADRVFQGYLQTVEPLLDALSASFASVALRRLVGATDLLSDERATELIEGHEDLTHLFVWMLSTLEEDGVLVRGPGGWQFNPDVPLPEPVAIWNALISEHPDHFALVHAAGRVGLHLADLFDGRAGPAQLGTRGLTSRNALAALLGPHGWGMIEQALIQCVRQHLGQLPPGQRMRLIEVCEGAPELAPQILHGLSDDILDCLAVASNGNASDPGQSGYEQVPSTHLPRIRTMALGQAVDATDASTCDMAIMVQAFATPADLLKALRQTRQMLAPGGVLLFLGLPAARWPSLIFGTEGAWWSDPTDTGLRQPMGSRLQWQQLLRGEGFSVDDSIPLSDDPATNAAAPCLLLATVTAVADWQPAPMQPPVPAGIWLVLAPEDAPRPSFSDQLAGQLQAGGHATLVIRKTAQADWTDPAHVAAQLATLRSQHGAIAGLVDLPATDPGHAPQPGDPGSARSPQPSLRCELATALVQACEQLELSLACWFVTTSPQQQQAAGDASLRAFVRVLRNEPIRLNPRVVDIDPPQDPAAQDRLARDLLVELLDPDQESELLLRGHGARYAPRLRHAPRYLPQPTQDRGGQNIRLAFSVPGQLRNLRWEPYAQPDLGPDDVRIDVEATGLNFRDVMYALGMLPDEAVEAGFAGASMGLECAGTVCAVGPAVRALAPGDRVVAFASSCFGRSVTTRASAAALFPGAMSMEAAATIPTTFFTAYYAIHQLAQLREGERILIQGAAGGVGIAAMQIARHLGAEIFATAGSDEKRDFLRLMGADHVFDSRSLAFTDQIMALTGGRGVDVVLNSLAGEAVNRSLRILKPFGRFLELGKRDFYENTRIGLRPFRNNISYFGIDADQLLVEQPALSQTLFQEVMALFASGVLHPLPFAAFEAEHVVDAFRHMQQSRHIGKVVVTYRRGIPHAFRAPPRRTPLQLRGDATYLVTGGLGGFGLRTAQWLVSKGARHLVLLSRSGPVSGEAQAAVAAMESSGVQVRAVACDVSDAQAMQVLAQVIAVTMPALRGVVHAAAVFDDAMVGNTDIGRLRRVFAPKALGAWNLHQLTASIPLDFFVLYSSVTTAFGNPGQSAYVAANAWLESLAQKRRAAGLPALCVCWGPIDDVGYLARNLAIKDALHARTGGHALTSAQALQMLEELMLTDRSGLCVADLNWRTMARFLPSASEPKFSDMAVYSGDHAVADEQPQDVARMLTDLAPDALAVAFRAMLKTEISEILRVAPDKIDDMGSVYDLGLDSLMGVELALAIESRFGVKLPVMVLSDSPTVAKLADRIIAQLRGNHADAESIDSSLLETQVHSAVSQHAVQVDAETIALFANDLLSSGSQRKHVRIIH